MVAAPGLDTSKEKVWYAKGRQPQFHNERVIDQLIGMVTALASELAILRDRVDTHERLASDATAATYENVEAYVPPAAAAGLRSALHQRLLRKVFRVLREDMARQVGPQDEAALDRSTKDYQGA